MNDWHALAAHRPVAMTIAAAAVAFGVAAAWLWQRRRRTGRDAAWVCVVMTVVLHALLLIGLPWVQSIGSGRGSSGHQDRTSVDVASADDFDPTELAVSLIMPPDNAGSEAAAAAMTSSMPAPLPVASLASFTAPSSLIKDPSLDDPSLLEVPPGKEAIDAPAVDIDPASLDLQPPLPPDASLSDASLSQSWMDELDRWIAPQLPTETLTGPSPKPESAPTSASTLQPTSPPSDAPNLAQMVSIEDAGAAPADRDQDRSGVAFASRSGTAKETALRMGGGGADTQAAVAAGLRFLASTQAADGGWHSFDTSGGIERSPLGHARPQAGTRSDHGITGLSLLAMLGDGHTHTRGDHVEAVYRGLSYLISGQAADGSMAGSATLYAQTYCHGIASLAVAECAAMTGDPSAVEVTRRAIAHSRRLQHPTTGGWRYTAGDPGDLSQLGWQAMLIDASERAGVAVDPAMRRGVGRFLQSVRGGGGGLARYRPGERVTPTMTAEALATRSLLGLDVGRAEAAEAERYLLANRPGTAATNLYYWYYASLALHQRGGDAWQTWNDSMKRRLLTTQNPDGSWPTTCVWGGYGGRAYSTAMAVLCLEVYYRHEAVGDG